MAELDGDDLIIFSVGTYRIRAECVPDNGSQLAPQLPDFCWHLLSILAVANHAGANLVEEINYSLIQLISGWKEI